MIPQLTVALAILFLPLISFLVLIFFLANASSKKAVSSAQHFLVQIFF